MGFLDLPNTHLNVARSGAHASEMLQQAEDLVAKIQASNQIDYDNDWKLISVLIGSNDVCQLPCTNDSLGEPDIWIQNITTALDYLKDNLPRTFVNLVQLSNIDDNMRDTTRNMTYGPTCASFYEEACPCSSFGANSIGDEFVETLLQYRQNIESLINSGRYDDSVGNFTVVLQPLLTSIEFSMEHSGETDLSSVAVDCQHFSAKGSAEIARALWNNMLQRVGEKTTILKQPYTEITCPTDVEPYFFTSKSSHYVVAQSGKLNSCSVDFFTFNLIIIIGSPHLIPLPIPILLVVVVSILYVNVL